MTDSQATSQAAAPRAGAKRVAVTLVAALTVGYGLVTTILLLADLVMDKQLPAIEMFNMLMPSVLFPLFALALICLLLRQWRPALAALPALIAFIVYYGPLLAPKSIAAPEGARELSVLTYNLHAEWSQFEPMAALIREANADVVALQELGAPAAQYFAERLSELYPYQALHTDSQEFIIGQGVLSRYPIVEDRYLTEKYGQQRTVLDVGGRRVVLYNVHPTAPFARQSGTLVFDAQDRGASLHSVLELAARETDPLILAGDFNMTDRTADYARVTERYRDAFRQTGQGLGFTLPDYSTPQAFAFAVRLPDWLKLSWLPVPLLTRIDYVFHNEAFASLDAKVWPTSGGSDHRPVFARLALLEDGEPGETRRIEPN